MSTNKNRPTSFTRLGLKLGWCAFIGAMEFLLTTPAMARAESARFDIAAQPLPAALKAFAGQAHMQLLYEHDAVAGTNGNAVIGELDKQTALVQLLRDTGLEAVYSSESAATIRPADKQVQQKSQADESSRSRVVQVTRPTAERRSSGDSGIASLEEVIVTARRQAENAQTVPISITAVSQQTLQDNNIATVADLQHLVPSMSGTVGSRDTFTVAIRGQTESNGRPGVIMYLNEIPLPPGEGTGGIASGPGLLFDLENVQVLKGPQGTLFGLNSVGGSILLQSARPKKEFGGRVQVSYGNYNDREIDAAVNLPIVDDVLLTRIAFTGGKRDGFTWLQADPDHPNGVDIDNRDYWAVRGSVTFRPSERFENNTVATYQDYKSNGSVYTLTDVNPLSVAGFSGGLTFLAQQQALGIRTHIPIDTPINSSGTMFSISNVSTLELGGDLKWRTLLGYDRSVTYRASDGDTMPLPLGNAPSTVRVLPVRQYTAETQLLGKSFGGRLDWIAGAFYLNNPFENNPIQTGRVAFSPFDFKSSLTATSKALFTQGNYDLSNLLTGLKATAGLRYTWDSKTTRGVPGGFGTDCTSTPTIGCSDSDFIRTHYESSALTWTTGLDYQVTPETLLYLASRRGYRAGGINSDSLGTTVSTYDPEYVRDYELGIKSDWKVAGRPVRTNAAVYLQDYTDIQVSQSLRTGVATFTTLTANASKARLWGGELETLLHLTDDLELGANASYLNIKYTDFDVGDPDDPVTGPTVRSTITDIKSREKFNPAWQYNLRALYHLPLDRQLGDLSVQADWNWQAKFETTLSVNFGTIKIPAYGLLNMAVNWDRIGGSSMDASFFMSNVQNKEYVVGGVSLYNLLGYNTQLYGEPRMYGVRLRYRFGAQ